MNFLAHFHLAWPDEDLVAGGLEGDYHKGPLPGRLPRPLLPGVRLHRAIDAFTDRHPTLTELRRRFAPEARRYAGILLDLSFDYYLSRHWNDFSSTGQGEFSREVYGVLARRAPELSEPARRMASRLEEYDLLMQYRHWETVTGAAARIGGRLRRPNPLHRAESLLAPLHGELERAFLRFYPELQRFCSDNSAMLLAPENKDSRHA